MIIENIIDMKNIKDNQLSIVGGKGLNLGIMISNDIIVPEGFVVTSHVYKNYINYNNMLKFIEEKIKLINKENIDKVLQEIQQEMLNGEFQKEVENEILDVYNSFSNPVHLAVRSSATAEDLEEASFAGQQETYLNITSYEDLVMAIKKCYVSLWGKRSFIYRENTRFEHMEVAIAVVIQKMINSDISGVLFTANPSSGEKEIIIDASYGLGEAIVSGKVTPDNYILDEYGNEKDCIIGSKEISMIYSKNGIKEVKNSKENREKRCLSIEMLKRLYEEAKKVEALYNKPMDIEWAMKDNKFYILQARAITTIRNISTDRRVYTKKEKKYINNMVEHFPVLCYPLDYEVAMILQKMKYELFQEAGLYVNNPLNMDDKGIIRMGNINIRVSPRIFKIPKIYSEYKKKSKNIKKGEEILNYCTEEINYLEKKIMGKKEVYSLQEIKIYLEKLISIHKKISYARFRYFLFPAIIIGKKLDKEIKKINEFYTEYDLLSDLKYVTININKGINDISKKIKDNKILMKEIKSGVDYEVIKSKYNKECMLIDNFLEAYGWKSNYYCFPFSSVSWNEDTNRLLNLLLIYQDTETNVCDMSNKYSDIIENLKENNTSKKYNKLIDDISYYRLAHVKREESQYFWEKGFGFMRILLNDVSKNIGVSYDELLYLRMSELKEILDQNTFSEKYKQKIYYRQEFRQEAENIWEQMTIEAFNGDDELQFKGISGSIGTVKGKVCIVKNFDDFNKLKKGEILVCPYTGPEWTPLFKIAKAVVSDTGGALSHAAIVAREYKIPAVLGVGNATLVLNDGDYIIVDGNNGLVKKISDN